MKVQKVIPTLTFPPPEEPDVMPIVNEAARLPRHDKNHRATENGSQSLLPDRGAERWGMAAHALQSSHPAAKVTLKGRLTFQPHRWTDTSGGALG